MTLTILDDLEQKSEEWLAARRGILTASVIGRLIASGPPDVSMVACPTCGVDVGPCMSINRKTPVVLKGVHDSRTKAADDLPPVLRPAETDTAKALTYELAAERITGTSEYVFVNADMERGNEVEPLARDLYSEHFNRPVDQVGFMVRDFSLPDPECRHSSLSGIDDTPLDDPEKRWRCHECDLIVWDTGRTNIPVRIGYSPDGLVGDDGLIEVKGPRAKKHLRTIVEDQVPAEHMPQIQCGLLVSGRQWCDFLTYFGGMRPYPIRVHADPKWADVIIAAAALFERNVQQIVATYEARTAELPTTEPLPTYEEITF